jgi:hypothetical protein
MYASFEEKGKIYTDVVTKAPIEVLIRTHQQLIRGKVHIRPQDRLKEELDKLEMFLAVTDAVVVDENGIEKYQTNFIAINRSHIIWLIPISDIKEAGSSE